MTATALGTLLPHGTEDLQVRLWERFAAMAIESIQQAGVLLASKGLGFDHTLSDGYWSEKPREVYKTKVRVPLENGITDPLVRALEVVRQSAPEDHLISRLQVCFVQQQPRATQKRVGSKAYTTDIQIRSLKVEKLDLRVEAKMLFAGKDVSAYCGPDGLLRFADAEPYTDQPVGMMLGYSARRDDAHWLKLIEGKSKPSDAVIGFHQVGLASGPVSASVLRSHATQNVVVLHMLLPFESDPSARQLDATASAAKKKPHKMIA
ncbi:hypothetical protein VH569_28085 [Azospirillum sp. 11R-A]|uniref:hypothetical protein n=1 Tax=Azospirillum sp. 11R-A TaxID=3111634 RepID=UPI003C205A11